MGHDELVTVPVLAHEQFPGQRFVRTSGIDAHHGIVRFEWELADEDGAVSVAGLDVGIVADDGRLSRIAGFFGPAPRARVLSRHRLMEPQIACPPHRGLGAAGAGPTRG